MSDEQAVLIALRQIIRAMDLHSRRLRKISGLTAPQLLLLQTIQRSHGVSISKLAAQISLSQATVTTIIDRLESRALVRRRRSAADKRVVHVDLTEAGETVLRAAPAPLQEEFQKRFAALANWERSALVSSLQRVAVLMNAEGIDAAPVLSIDSEVSPPDLGEEWPPVASAEVPSDEP